MSHVPLSCRNWGQHNPMGCGRINFKSLTGTAWSLVPQKIPLCTPRAVNSWQLEHKYCPNSPDLLRWHCCVLGKVQTSPFLSGFTPTSSICGKLIPWPHPSLATSGRFLASPVMKWWIQGVWICPWPRVPCDVLSSSRLMCNLGG